MNISIILGTSGKRVDALDVLSTEETSRSRLMNFKLSASKLVVDEMIKHLMLKENLPVRLEPKIISALYDRFLSSDWSIFSVLQSLKLALLDHFAEVDSAFLCLMDKDDEEIEGHCSELGIDRDLAKRAVEINCELRKKVRPFVLECVIRAGE